MATALETALANVEAQIASLTANYKPTYSIDGKSVSWESYLNSLLAAQEKLREAIIRAEGPAEVHVTGTT